MADSDKVSWAELSTQEPNGKATVSWADSEPSEARLEMSSDMREVPSSGETAKESSGSLRAEEDDSLAKLAEDLASYRLPVEPTTYRSPRSFSASQIDEQDKDDSELSNAEDLSQERNLCQRKRFSEPQLKFASKDHQEGNHDSFDEHNVPEVAVTSDDESQTEDGHTQKEPKLDCDEKRTEPLRVRWSDGPQENEVPSRPVSPKTIDLAPDVQPQIYEPHESARPGRASSQFEDQPSAETASSVDNKVSEDDYQAELELLAECIGGRKVRRLHKKLKSGSSTSSHDSGPPKFSKQYTSIRPSIMDFMWDSSSEEEKKHKAEQREDRQRRSLERKIREEHENVKLRMNLPVVQNWFWEEYGEWKDNKEVLKGMRKAMHEAKSFPRKKSAKNQSQEMPSQDDGKTDDKASSTVDSNDVQNQAESSTIDNVDSMTCQSLNRELGTNDTSLPSKAPVSHQQRAPANSHNGQTESSAGRPRSGSFNRKDYTPSIRSRLTQEMRRSADEEVESVAESALRSILEHDSDKNGVKQSLKNIPPKPVTENSQARQSGNKLQASGDEKDQSPHNNESAPDVPGSLDSSVNDMPYPKPSRWNRFKIKVVRKLSGKTDKKGKGKEKEPVEGAETLDTNGLPVERSQGTKEKPAGKKAMGRPEKSGLGAMEVFMKSPTRKASTSSTSLQIKRTASKKMGFDGTDEADEVAGPAGHGMAAQIDEAIDMDSCKICKGLMASPTGNTKEAEETVVEVQPAEARSWFRRAQKQTSSLEEPPAEVEGEPMQKPKGTWRSSMRRT